MSTHTLTSAPGVARTITASWQRGRVQVSPGTELSIKGMRGRVRFRQHVRLVDGREWIDVVHPELGFYSFRPERVRVVHRAARTRPVRARARASRPAVAA